ncbi:threonine ammonia-lyase [Seinonella peptonophila]|uniref:threonine ammonia-lyase n=1 Tax=Seinonella peptonophila TaxID=112248 RepID=UPI001FE33F02|nr:pyridoxal-phosphate dependent enzyme [Seinonella peptonophila]
MTFSDIVQAADNIEGKVENTPLLYWDDVSNLAKAEVWVKFENWQIGGAFKARGAYNLVSSLGSGDFVTVSSGSFGKVMAKAIAEKPGASLTTVVPFTVPEHKIKAIQYYGSEVIKYGAEYKEAEAFAYDLAAQTGRRMLDLESKEAIAGQGTVALEALEFEDFDVILAPAGSGGLVCATAIVAKNLCPRAKVFGVQSEASPAWYASFQAKKLVPVEYKSSIAESLHGGISQSLLDLALEVVDGFVLVSEASIEYAINLAAKKICMIFEGSGAVGIAALLSRRVPDVEGKKVLVIASGGNLSLDALTDIFKRYRD